MLKAEPCLKVGVGAGNFWHVRDREIEESIFVIPFQLLLRQHSFTVCLLGGQTTLACLFALQTNTHKQIQYSIIFQTLYIKERKRWSTPCCWNIAQDRWLMGFFLFYSPTLTPCCLVASPLCSISLWRSSFCLPAPLIKQKKDSAPLIWEAQKKMLLRDDSVILHDECESCM